jgi:hypothetical protein
MLHRDSSRHRDKFTLFKETHPVRLAVAAQ